MNPTVPMNESYSPSEWILPCQWMNPTVPVNGTVPMDPVVQVTPSAVPPELYYRYSNDTHDAAGRWEDSISQRHKTHPTPLFSNRHLIWVSPHFIFWYRQLLGVCWRLKPTSRDCSQRTRPLSSTSWSTPVRQQFSQDVDVSAVV